MKLSKYMAYLGYINIFRVIGELSMWRNWQKINTIGCQEKEFYSPPKPCNVFTILSPELPSHQALPFRVSAYNLLHITVRK